MVVRRTKKINKRRGQRSPGYGSQKKHRGGGSRGGRGKAGLHKHKRMSIFRYYPEHYGKRGFKRPEKITKKFEVINIKHLDGMIDQLLEEKKVQKEKDTIIVKLDELGYDKLLGTGKLNHKLIVEAKAFSKSAIKKLEEGKGKAITV